MTDNNKDKSYPGYPHYPASEDITRANNNNGKKSLDGDNTPLPQQNDTIDTRDKDAQIVDGTDADVSQEDLRMLDAAEQNMDSVDDANLITGSLDNADDDGDPLNEDDSINTDMSGQDLDVPGSEDDDADEKIGEEDEENNYYSLGGDNHEAQEENNGDQ